jgi:2-keto-4-pentenoate hydratase/2-oxohepta-3-ene-1,7-dioic acid hydratase in catechol pathway
MKLATYIHDGQEHVGAVVAGRIFDLAACLRSSGAGEPASAASVIALLAGGPDALARAGEALAWAESRGGPQLAHALGDVELRAPIPCPGKLLCLAGNYASHILEAGRPFAGKEKMIPRFFMKPCTSVIGTGGAIRVPASTGFADWELELAVVIGTRGRDLTAAQAPAHIAGYTIFNDISARELTFRRELPQQEGDWFFDWLVGKWLDTFGPMGPWLTTADEIAHPDNLRIQLWHNGRLQQDGNTGQMIFSPAESIAFISQFVTLHPGDVISTGTPAGVGMFKKVRLEAGDRIRGEIEGLGVIENSIERLE